MVAKAESLFRGVLRRKYSTYADSSDGSYNSIVIVAVGGPIRVRHCRRCRCPPPPPHPLTGCYSGIREYVVKALHKNYISLFPTSHQYVLFLCCHEFDAAA